MLNESQSPSPPPSDARPFRCEVDRESGLARVRAIGELDLGTVPILEAEVASLREAGFRRLILDLSRLDFIDSTGLRCILDCDGQARRNGFSFALVRGPDAVQRLFELTETSTRLPFVDP